MESRRSESSQTHETDVCVENWPVFYGRGKALNSYLGIARAYVQLLETLGSNVSFSNSITAFTTEGYFTCSKTRVQLEVLHKIHLNRKFNLNGA